MLEKGKRYDRCDINKFENIPVSLKVLPQWVCWQAEWREERGKFSKIPLNPNTGREAKSNAPTTWGTYDEAINLFSHNSTITGIGFEFSVQDPFTFIDLDDARDASTGNIDDGAQEIIKSLDSYTEISPSGTGLRIIIEADPVGSAKRRGKIEIYSFGQYATITGDVLINKEIAKRQGELADFYHLIFGQEEPESQSPPVVDDAKLARVRAISDDDLIARATSAANGKKFMELWNAENVSDHSTADAALCGLLRYWTRADAPRIDKLFRLSKLMRPKWDHHRGSETYGQRTIRFTINGPGPLYDPEVIVGGRNDRSNCEVFMQLHGTEYTYVKESKRWLRWNSHHWAGDAELDVLHHCEDVSEVLLRQARTNPSAEAAEQRAMIKWANDSGNKVRRDAIESFARTRLYRDANLFDRNNYLLACKNGIVDLRTGDLRDGQPTDWITRATNVAYLPKAQCPIFDKFLRESMCGDDEMIAYIWRVMGYSITGDTTERAFFLLHGEGRNGKTTFVETLQAMLGHENGGYAQRARFSTFLKKTIVGGIPDDIAHLAGARLIVASEADEHAPLDTAVIKELTGGDSIRARHLHSKEFQFNPIFKLMLVTNHIPPIRESTYSLWDRLHYIGFSYRVPDEKVDKSLRNKLLGELEGILAKSVLACLEWQRNGLEPPVKVVEGRQNLYQEEDLVGKFLREKCQPADADKTLSAMKLYGTFGGWCRQNGLQRIPTNKWFIAELHRKNYVDRTVNGEVLWLGIKWLEQQYSADF